MDSTVRGILQARILEWVAIPFSRGSSQPRDRTWVSCVAGGFSTVWAKGKPFMGESAMSITKNPNMFSLLNIAFSSSYLWDRCLHVTAPTSLYHPSQASNPSVSMLVPQFCTLSPSLEALILKPPRHLTPLSSYSRRRVNLSSKRLNHQGKKPPIYPFFPSHHGEKNLALFLPKWTRLCLSLLGDNLCYTWWL